MLALVDVKWSSWRGPIFNPGTADPWKRHHLMLCNLLGGADDPDVVLDASVRHLPGSFDGLNQKQLGERQWRLVEPIVTTAKDLPRGWQTGRTAANVLGDVRDGLKRCDELLNRLQVDDEQLMTRLLNLFQCRIYLQDWQLGRMTGQDTAAAAGPGPACLDFKFQWHAGTYWLYVYVWLWSGIPASGELSAAPSTDVENRLARVDLARRRAEFENISDTFSVKCLYHYFPPVEFTAKGRKHLPPRFWVVSAATTKDVFRAPHGTSELDYFTHALLDAGSDNTGVADGVLTPVAERTADGRRAVTEQARVLRRIVPGKGAPAYLVVPNPQASAAKRETAVQKVILRLTDIETGMAAELFDLTTDLEVDQTLIDVYQSVQQRASVLWDQLAMFLPDSKGTAKLDRVHRLIQLIHLILLQGIADMDWVLARAERAAAVVTEQQHNVGDRFDKEFTERPVSPMAVREGLLTSGYVASTLRVAERTAKAGARVRGAYQSLIDGIGGAYDDRRVRHTDRIGLLAVLVAVGLAGIGLVTETYAMVLRDRPLVVSATILMLLVLAFGVLSWTMWIKWFRNIGEVATVQFAPRYHQLREYLSNCRTDRLSRIRDREVQAVRRRLAEPGGDIELVWKQYYANWDRLDSTLTQQLASLLDSFDPDRPHPDLGGLPDVLHGIERWLQVGMLVSERPRSFSGFPLPRLMLLYRMYPIIRSELGASGASDGRLVADSDLLVGLRVHCNAKHDHIEELARWSRHAIRLDDHGRPVRCAMAFRADLASRLGIRAGMNRDEWNEALRRMSIDKEQTS